MHNTLLYYLNYIGLALAIFLADTFVSYTYNKLNLHLSFKSRLKFYTELYLDILFLISRSPSVA
jgi:hypothetical protein